MKKFILALFAMVLFAGKAQGVTVAPGGLEAALANTDVSKLTELVVDGSIDARDFHFIASKMPSLKRLNLANTKVEAYSSDKYLFANVLNYKANELPVGCFASMPLESVELPSTLFIVSDGAFAGCRNLTSIRVPESVRDIGDYAFSGDVMLTSVNLGSGVIEIGDYAFSKCVALSNIIMPAVQKIGAYAFLGCESLQNVRFPFPLSVIGEGGFKESGLTAVDMSESTGLLALGAWAFADTKNLVSVTIPMYLKVIGEGAFFYSTKLEKVVMPEGVTVINNYAFGNTERMNDENFLPTTVKRIGDYAFDSWKSVVRFVIPENVDSIGNGAFKDWQALSVLNAKPVTPPALGADVWQNIDKTAVHLEVPQVSTGAYKNADQWRDFFFSGSFVEENIESAKVKFVVDGDILTISSNSGLKGAAIFDLSGIVIVQKVANSPSLSFDLSGYSAKAYIVRCVCADDSVEYIKFGKK